MLKQKGGLRVTVKPTQNVKKTSSKDLIVCVGSRLASLFALCSLQIAIFLMPNNIAFAQAADEQQWWFDVEFIAFKRSLEPSNNEDFSQADFLMTQTRGIDLLSLPAIKQQIGLQAYVELVPSCIGVKENTKPYSSFFKSTSKNNQDALMVDLSPLVPIEEKQESLEKLISSKQQDLLPELYMYEKLPDLSMRVTCRVVGDTSDLDIIDDIGLSMRLASNHSASNDSQELDQIPQRVFSNRTYFTGHHFILPETETNLAELSKDVFRQRGIEPLLYTAWRQRVVFGEDAAEFYRIRAGELFKFKGNQQSQPSPELLAKMQVIDANSANGEQEHDNRAFFARLKDALAKEQTPDWLYQENISDNSIDDTSAADAQWELNGLFKVYLDYVNQVPYLHIDSEFKHYKLNINENGEPELDVYPFKQRRRIISKQIHYFDHPAFGIIVRLERYTPPKPIIDATTTTSE